ncbi:MAG: MRP family ATP-binding protein [Actinobacteria bacterium]|nr:MRP family ATP-binding protein [Actinomycetota bacterium]NCW91834.1 MRP family ATP-binding protein [Actinomycetota bacterium]NCZ61210.1 MRP family ATP-binding protein [Actinomycetota bacterium]NDA44440.1 MRP family ATP-binding protein [Actinomycetota bacterium]NDE39010.1 MRP family ATP-binding protein [Actinomycetota bacterium]
MNFIDSLNEALSKVQDPELHRSITELGMVEELTEVNGDVSIKVLLTISGCPMQDRLRGDITTALNNVEGVKSVELAFGVMSQEQRDYVKKVVRGGREKTITFAQPESLTRVIGIASGKGGVGKSSVTANLGVAFAKKGLRVGILDADVYGHSIPRLMGLMGQRPTAIDQLFIPLESFGVKVVSMEMFKPERSDPVAYRGPLLHRVLEQLLSDAHWGDLDVLLIDLPPGTGDLAISLGQLIPNSEIVVVTTPQIAAAEVAERAGRIAHQIHQRVIGVIENMSEYGCPTCGEKIALFGSGGGEETSRRLSALVGIDVPLLGKIAFNPELRTGGDDGVPLVQAAPNSESAQSILEIAEILVKRSKSLVGVRLGISPESN